MATDRMRLRFHPLWRFLNGEPELVRQNVHYLLVYSAVGFAAAILFDDTAVISAFFAFALWVSAAALTDWRTERGLWMLALVYLLSFGFTYACIMIGQARDILRGVQVESIALLVDAALGTLLLSILMRFLVRVIQQNFAISYSSDDKGT
jgi:hypothetical protein